MWIITGLLLWLFLCASVLLAALCAVPYGTAEVKHANVNRSDNDPFAFLFE